MPRSAGARIRRATHRDLETLVRHRRAMWEGIGGFRVADLDAGDPVYRRWTERMMRARRFIGWIAENGAGAPIGSGAVWLTEVQPRPGEWTRGRPYILSMYTDPDHRGEGIASAIVRSAVRYARENGYSRITLHASKMGRPVYRGLGFERTWEMRRMLGAPRRRSARRGARPTAG